MLPNTYPNVIIHGKTIIHDLPLALCHAAQMPDYRDYFKDKFQLTDKVCNDINWLSLKFAL